MSSPKGHCTAISNSQPTLPGNHQDPRQVLVLSLRARDPQLQPLRGQGSRHQAVPCAFKERQEGCQPSGPQKTSR